MSTEEEPIERRVGEALSTTGATVALAESCTGGLIASLLTDVPGASEYVDRSLVAYAYDAHRTLLGVSRETLDTHGTVSEASANQMARAARDGADTTWGLAATGVLGPGGGTPQNPSGRPSSPLPTPASGNRAPPGRALHATRSMATDGR